LEGRHARMHRGRASAAPCRHPGVLHDRRGAAAEGRLPARGARARDRGPRGGAWGARRHDDRARPGHRDPPGRAGMTSRAEPELALTARAPGKAVVLGEYAVLGGAPALVLAVDRYCSASIGPRPGEISRIETRFPDPVRAEAALGGATGVELVDL